MFVDPVLFVAVVLVLGTGSVLTIWMDNMEGLDIISSPSHLSSLLFSWLCSLLISVLSMLGELSQGARTGDWPMLKPF